MLIIISSIIALITTPLLIKFSQWRVSNGKLFTSMLETYEQEEEALKAILSDPYNFYWLSQLDPLYLSHPIFLEVYPKLLTYYKSLPWYPDFSSFKDAHKWLNERRGEKLVDANFVTKLITDSFRNHKIEIPQSRNLKDTEVNAINQDLLASLENKKDSNVLSTVVKKESTGNSSYERILKSFPKSLWVLVCALIGFANFSFFKLVDYKYLTNTGLSKFLIVATLSILLYSSLIWAIIDIYTMFLDFPFFLISSLISSLFLLITILTLPGKMVDNFTQLFYSILAPCVILIFILLILTLYKRVRGVDGMGTGDFYILFPVTAIPLYFISNFTFAFHSFIFSNILGILGWLVLRVQRKVSKDSPFAFGPYLAVGWVLVFSLYTLTKAFN